MTEDAKLVVMSHDSPKDGVALQAVHPTAVKSHLDIGWKVVHGQDAMDRYTKQEDERAKIAAAAKAAEKEAAKKAAALAAGEDYEAPTPRASAPAPANKPTDTSQPFGGGSQTSGKK